MDPERQERNLVNAYWEAYDRRKEARDAADTRDIRRAREWQLHVDTLELGEEPMDANTEAFENRWHKRDKALAWNLLSAEQAFANARANAREGGIEMSRKSQSSGYTNIEVNARTIDERNNEQFPGRHSLPQAFNPYLSTAASRHRRASIGGKLAVNIMRSRSGRSFLVSWIQERVVHATYAKLTSPASFTPR